MIPVRVAAGILRAQDGRVLIGQRAGGGTFAGLWEFPGGKLIDGESAEAALRRELHEELGIEIRELAYFGSVEHEYQDRAVAIDFFLVNDWSPDPSGREGQELRWLEISELDETQLLPADAPIIRSLRENEVSDRQRQLSKC